MSPFDHPVVSERYFFPRRTALSDPYWVETAGGDRLACLYRPAPSGGRTVVYFHGNGEVAGDGEVLLAPFAEIGLGVLLVEYRGYGASTGVPQLAAMLDDVNAVHASLGLDVSSLFVFGRSIGSIYAIEYAARHGGLAGLILESSIADVRERILLRATPDELECTAEEIAAAVAKDFDHEAKLNAYLGPLLVLHAKHDHLVEVSHGRRNHAWGGGDHKTLEVFRWGDHNSILPENWERYWATVARFVEASK